MTNQSSRVSLALLPEVPAARSNSTIRSEFRLLHSPRGKHLFVVNGSRLYDIPEETASAVEQLLAANGAGGELDGLLGTGKRYIGADPPDLPPLHSLSLNVAQACNMSCHYCYADEGKFGGSARLMPEEVARHAVDRLLEDSSPGATVLVGFMGGEPLLHRELVHWTTRYATAAAEKAGRHVRFSITTNGTLLTKEDVLLFSEFPFSVQVSLDGDRVTNDVTRPMRDGSGSYDRVLAGLRWFEQCGRPRQLSVRVTVSPRSRDLLGVLEHLIGLGFDDVGFSPVLVSPDPAYAFQSEDFDRFLRQMIECGAATIRRLIAGQPFPFGNLLTALGEIHRGTHRPYPCGAGAGYLSVSAEGGLYACHRLVDDPAFGLGDLKVGPDHIRRAQLLSDRHVDRIEPCRSCWARYLCGGGCYHEVTRRGRIGCDYIRGWLDYCLSTYAEISEQCPELFSSPLSAGHSGAMNLDQWGQYGE